MRHRARQCTPQSYANAVPAIVRPAPAINVPPRQSGAHGRNANAIEEEDSTCHDLVHRTEHRRSMWLAGRHAAGAKGDS